MFKKMTALLLCVMLVVGLFGCTSGTAGTTTAPTGSQPLDSYTAAVSAVKNASSMTLTITTAKTMTVGESEFQEQSAKTLILSGIGTGTFTASSTDLIRWLDGYQVSVSEEFADGTYYQTVSARPYSMEMTAEDFLSRQVPAVLLTPELYESVTFAEDGSIAFSGATGLESWLASETAVLTQASGTATLDESGALVSSTYDVCYTDGPAAFELSITVAVDLTQAEPKAPLTVAYDAIDHPDAILAQERAYGYLLQADSVTTVSSETIFSYAAAYLQTEQITVNAWGTGDDQVSKVAYDITGIDYTTMQTDTYDQEESFMDGTYTFSTGTSDPQEDSTIDAATMTEYWRGIVCDNMIDLSYVDSLETSDLGEYLLVENTHTIEFGKNLNEYTSYTIFGDAGFLDDYASAYRTETATSYMGIDVLTGLPTSVGITYEGIHTIDGVEYSMTYEVTQTFDLGSLGSYEAVTGEPLPVEEEPAAITPVFYHVTGGDGQEMWLLGTIHIGDARTTNLPQQILDAFAASDALAVEFDDESFMDALETDEDLQAAVAEAYYFTDGTTAQDHIEDAELWDYTEDMLKVIGNYSSTTLMMKPYILANTIQNWFQDWGYELTSGYGVDNQLMDLAREQGKEIRDVESGLFQIQVITGFSDALQELILLDTLSTTAIEYNADCKELFEMWCAGDEAALIAYLNEDSGGELTDEEQALLDEYNAAMGADRNDDMLNVAIGYLESGETVFYAVGLAHLLEETGLVNTLREAGYTVELVPYT